MIKGFFSWWFSELASLVPGTKAWRGAAGSSAAAKPKAGLVLDLTGERTRIFKNSDPAKTVTVLERDGSGAFAPSVAETLKQKGFASSAVAIWLPVDKAIRRQLTMPKAVEGDLRAALRFMIESQTPLKDSDAYFDFHVLGRDKAANKIEVELVVAPRWVVDRVVSEAEGVGMQAAGLDFVEVGQGPIGVNLLPSAVATEGKAQGRGFIGRSLQVTAALLLIVLLASPVLNQAWIALGLEAQLDQSSADAKAASKTYSQFLDMRKNAAFFIHAKKTRPSALKAMEELARILPSDTYLRSLRLTGDELQIVGDSKDASRLIEIVEHSPQFNGAHFASALVGNKEGGTERFAMTAKIVPVGGGE